MRMNLPDATISPSAVVGWRSAWLICLATRSVAVQVSRGGQQERFMALTSLRNTTLWTEWFATSGAELGLAALTGLLSNTGPLRTH